jgi:hypothetical protein
MKWFLALLGIFFVMPPVGGWRQESFSGVPFQLTSAVAVCPTANGCWTFTNSFTGDPTSLPTGSISSVIPNRANQWATITDISVTCSGGHPEDWSLFRSFENGSPSYYAQWSVYSTPFPSCLVIRDGNTGQVLYTGALQVGYGDDDEYNVLVTTGLSPNTVYNSYYLAYEKGSFFLNCHLSTPLVLDHSGPNPPTFEICPFTPDTHYSTGQGNGYYFGSGSMPLGSGPGLVWTDGLVGTISVQGRYVYNT